MKIQVLFGSERDERVFGPLCRLLEKNGDVHFAVASAHRDPDKVHDIVKNGGADVFVAGAGLAAHLPGVVASLTTKPVFGVSVNGAFSGLDAFLSIAQMPRGVPVMGVTEENLDTVSALLTKLKTLPSDKIYLNWNRQQQNYSPVHAALQDLQIQSEVAVEWCEAQDEKCWGEIISPTDNPESKGVHLFLCEKEHLASVSTAFEFFAKARQGGAWVGVNNITNYALQWKKMQSLKAAVCN